jgi:hypothetical protein
MTLDDLVAMSADELDRTMKNGHPVDPDVLANREYDGVSLNLPKLLEKLTWVKFKKVFHRETDDSLRGWNCRVVQSPLEQTWELELKKGEPITYGHYAVEPCAAYRMPRAYDAGLMLDYGLGGNPRTDPTARLRDPIVAVNEGDSALLLGWSYVDAGIAKVGTPSYFVLRRGVELSHVVPPPRPVTRAG